ncbi:MAG: N-acetyltransferase [Dysgonamonadaceae bacterium]|jgi:predicted GNAT family acetyltransferase|nr:N-acetyltransferase [Dysgonamonadaceae bacterium]
MDVIRKDNGKQGVFLAIEDGIELGEMTYVWGGDDKIIIDHTGVRPEYEGQGVGQSLFHSAVNFAREEKIKIVPVCAFAIAMFRRAPENKDVLVN